MRRLTWVDTFRKCIKPLCHRKAHISWNFSYIIFFIWSKILEIRIKPPVCQSTVHTFSIHSIASVQPLPWLSKHYGNVKFDCEVTTSCPAMFTWIFMHYLSHYHTMLHFDALKIYSYGKHCEKRRNCL